MSNSPSEILLEGCKILDPIMHQYGFSFAFEGSGKGSGGEHASGAYVNGNRKLELHYRYSLGLVTYHFGETSVGHESYMRAILGTNDGNRYPGFSDEPLDGFRFLAYDLEHFASAFLLGRFTEFGKYITAAQEWENTPGFARLP